MSYDNLRTNLEIFFENRARDTCHIIVTSQFIFPICNEMAVVVTRDDILVCISVFLYTQANVHFISILHVKMVELKWLAS